MPHSPLITRTIPSLHRALDCLRNRGSTIALVPTMGALHDGHISLVRLAKQQAKKVVVSIFVNPIQFAPHEDLSSYPRTWKADITKLTAEGVDLVWNPDVRTMYPQNFTTRITVGGPATVGLEDRFRPHFFDGVATIVAKLFAQVMPDIAIFGEKDFQQLKVITRMKQDLNFNVKINSAPIIREPDGLAMSSRNIYLSRAEREAAPVLYKVLKDTIQRLRTGDSLSAALADGSNAIIAAGFALDYLEARHSETLAPISSMKDGRGRLLVAAKIGATRLIDNTKI